ncbi:MAG: hypothetical protein ABEJ82_01670 [Haloplanus sp.]
MSGDTADAGDATDASDRTDAGDAETRTTGRMRRALTEIRREGWKVAAIYGVVDAALVTLLVNLVVTFARPSALPARVPLPAAVVDALRTYAGATLAEPTVSSAAVVGAAAGLLAFAVEVAVRTRRPLIEQFEAANPEVRESLRTARDALRDGRESRIALRLYEDVLAGVKGSSSIGLVDLRRVTATVLIALVVSVATIHLAVVDISVLGGNGAGTQNPSGGTNADYGGLQDGSSILGEPEDVQPGEQRLETNIDTSGSGQGEGTASAESYADSGYAGGESVQSQRAGFAQQERLEDADLIRDYNLKIREQEDE